jgi:hypothetical protein
MNIVPKSNLLLRENINQRKSRTIVYEKHLNEKYI